MIIDEKTFNLIEDYLNNDLADKDLQAFEARLSTDTDLAKQVELHREVADVLSDDKAIDLQQKLSTIGEAHAQKYKAQTSSNVRPLFNWRLMAAAASVALLVFAGWWLVNLDNTETLYADFYAPYSDNSVTRTPETSVGDLREEGQIAYLSGDYAASLNSFQALSKLAKTTEDKYLEAEFYVGLSQMEMNNYSKALESFNKVISLGKDFADDALWYSALVYLKQENIEACKGALNKILLDHPNSWNVKSANALLEKME